MPHLPTSIVLDNDPPLKPYSPNPPSATICSALKPGLTHTLLLAALLIFAGGFYKLIGEGHITYSDETAQAQAQAQASQIAHINERPHEPALLIDISGTMDEPAMQAAKAALQTAISRLKTGDSFTIIEFNSHAGSLFPKPRIATQDSEAKTKHCVQSEQAAACT